MEPIPPAVEAQSLNHWTTREVLIPIFLMLRNQSSLEQGRVYKYYDGEKPLVPTWLPELDRGFTDAPSGLLLSLKAALFLLWDQCPSHWLSEPATGSAVLFSQLPQLPQGSSLLQ